MKPRCARFLESDQGEFPDRVGTSGRVDTPLACSCESRGDGILSAVSVGEVNLTEKQ